MLLSQNAVSDLPLGWQGTWIISSMSWAVSNESLCESMTNMQYGEKLCRLEKIFLSFFNIKTLKHFFNFSCKFNKSTYFGLTFLFFICVCNIIMTSREQQWR